ncbi:RNA-directed DNA polymerase, eukaryota, reverse transcriptase zinc-binding domain protein [Tanacetum coccineum]
MMKSKRNKNRVERIKDENGMVHEGSNVVEQFVLHFKKFLGESKSVMPIDENIFINKISEEDAAKMISEVSFDEIKDAIFDIDSNKAYGPDDFSSEFFKKAWEVVGNDVCLAVKEFFRKGKILGEVNATLIALILKTTTPSKVSEFRPIACCNVIYKCISKILTSRIKQGLNKIVNINQSAFIPGRHIQDNILLAQELMRGYNRKNGPKRCAMQIDIQKAYDTVSWRFLEDVLMKFAFPAKMGSQERGSYISLPFYFGNGGNKGSLKVVRKSLEEFSLVSGLNPNLGKSTIFFRSIKDRDELDLLEILPFKCGKLPVRFLGVPLLAKRLGVMDCKVLTDKASVYLLPNLVIKDLDKLFKRFLWNSGDSAQVLLIRQFWKIIENKDSLWAKWIRDSIKEPVWYKIRNGRRISMFYDKWCSNGPLCDFISKRAIYDARIKDNVVIADMMDGDSWKWPNEWLTKFPILSSINPPNLKIDKEDVLIPRHTFILWLAVQGKLMTQDRMERWHNTTDLKCALCKNYADSHDHLFFKCDFALKVWKDMLKKSYKLQDKIQLMEIVAIISNERNRNSIGMVVKKANVSCYCQFPVARKKSEIVQK